MKLLQLLLSAALLVSATSCSSGEAANNEDAQTTSAASAPSYKSVLIDDVPHVRQKPDFCGEACAEMFLKKLGKRIDQDAVFNQAGLDPLEGRGCWTRELVVALRRIGFQLGRVWHQVSADDADEELDSLFKSMHTDLAEGVPSIVCMHYDDKPHTTEHFRLIVGYDAKSDEIIYHEPAVANGGNRRMKRDVFLKLWPLKYDEQEWTVVRMRLEPGRIADLQPAEGLTNADYAQHVLRLKQRLRDLKEKQTALKREQEEQFRKELEAAKEEGKEEEKNLELAKRRKRIVSDFNIVLQKPFVVIGDESQATVQRRSEGTIEWAVERIKRDYFEKDPDHVIDIWLFKDKPSYEQNAYDLFGSWPHTPFGYYSSRNRALVMNISTGGGTLVHEIVHPFMAANFPGCPSWFNEGLASLYEQCGDNNGHIWGYTNWRLRGLQEKIRKAREAEEAEAEDAADKQLPSFKELCSTTTRQFYDQDKGTNYSQARYLCYYLQQRALLVRFYHDFRQSADDDPTGYETLVRLLGNPDMDEFQREWEDYVLRLRF